MRTLILKFGAIGDVVMAIPAAYALHLEGHTIDWVVGQAALPVLELYAWINVIPIDEAALLRGGPVAKLRAMAGVWRQIAGRRYELAATLYYDPRYRLLMVPVRARRKVMLSHVERDLRLIPGRHHTDEFARILLGRRDGVNHDRLAPIPVPSESLPASPLAARTRPRVVLAPAGAKNLMADDALRRWPAESYAELARRLLAQGFEVVLIGGAGDAWIQGAFTGLAVTDLIGSLSLPQTLALLGDSTVLVTHDTGPLHLAGITGVGIVTLFGPTDPRGRLPRRQGAFAIWGGEELACRPCYDGHSFAPCPSNDCMREIGVERVLDAVLTAVRPIE